MHARDAGTRGSHQPEASRGTDQLLRCRHCNEVIGVYEPLVRVIAGHMRESSRALEPNVSALAGEHYHRACYERLNHAQPHAD
jgi:hypothetical protein